MQDETTVPCTPLLVSACLLGDRVRYDAQLANDNSVIALANRGYHLIPVCPEVAGGLSVPRAAAEIVACEGGSGARRCVRNCRSEDVSEQFYRGAEAALALTREHGITTAVLKESSPSCGSSQIHDGTFSRRRIAGEGITTELLRANGVRVLSEQQLDLLDVDR